jgi:DNA-binding transcriptional regulator GbsR (MarR family)
MSAIRSPKRSSTAQRSAASNGGLSALEAEAIGLFVQLGRLVNQPRSFAEVYAILFVSTRPMTIADLAERLGGGKGTADRAVRFLHKAGALRIVYVPGDRRMHFEAVVELRHLVLGFVRDQILPKLASSADRINRLAEVVHKLPEGQRAKLSARATMLENWTKKSRNLVPIVERMLEG